MVSMIASLEARANRLASLIVLCLALASCTSLGTKSSEPFVLPSSGADNGSLSTQSELSAAAKAAGLSSTATELSKAKADGDTRAEAVLYRGNNRQVKIPPLREPVKLLGDAVSLNFEEAPLSEVMHAIMNDILALDYVVDHPVKGEVTLRTRTPVPRDQLLGILESLLKANNALMVRGEDNRFLITGDGHGAGLSGGASNAQNTGAGFSTSIIPLQFVSAGNMADILKPVADESAFVRVDTTRNLLMLRGTRDQLNGWMEMVATFDVDLLAGMSVGIFPLENTSVDEMDAALKGLLGGQGKKENGTDLGELVRIIPMVRLNSILVVTPRSQYLDRVGKWISRLDTQPDSNFEKQLHVYPIQNTTASRLADLLSSIYTGSSGQSGGSNNSNFGSSGRSSEVAPGLSQETIGSGSGSRSGSGSGSAGGGISSGVGQFANSEELSGSNGNSQFTFDDIRVVADDENNALLIYATGKDYKKIARALKDLDVVATQVIIEASILEVTLTDDLRYGLEWSFKGGLGNNYDGAGLLDTGAAGVNAVVPGFSYTVTNALGGDIRAVLNALSSQSLINVISTPSVMVLDNHTAYIHVGDQVPIFSAQTITDGGRTTQSVEYRDTGVKLSVRPSVNAGGLVTMDVEQSVSNIGAEIDPATGQSSFSERNISSRVAVRSNESVVLGGLIRENARSGSSGLPFLHKIPVIGALFGTTATGDSRTELLVIITPRVLNNEAELRAVSQEMRSRIRHMELIEVQP
ncbi:MAG: general secretion pathway protein D [Halioglobus sp.]|jgi:general secretion pathway protein D